MTQALSAPIPDSVVIGELEERISKAQENFQKAQLSLSPTSQAPSLTVTPEQIREVVALRTGIPAKELALAPQQETRLQKLQTLSERLSQKVIGQPEAIDLISRAIIRSHTGFRDPNRPIGVYLFLGMSGVGKTQTAKLLAEELFGSSKRMVRFDMSEYQQEHTVSQLIGSPPGYIGFEQGGRLTEQIKNHPHSVILFDEVEKAHPRLFDLLLQVFDEGILTSSRGETIDFTQTIIVLTSNLGTKDSYQSPIGFNPNLTVNDYQSLYGSIQTAVKDHFRPEFLNRLDETVVFRPLDEDSILAITRLLLQREQALLAQQEIAVAFDETATAYIARNCSDPINGARPIKRGIARLIEDKLSQLLVYQEIAKGDHILVTEENQELTVIRQ